METQRKRRNPMSEINVVPFIDVMLVLLIVFMVTAPLITQGINVDLPQADAEPVADSEEETLVVSINAQGEYFINLGAVDPDNPEPVALDTIGESIARILAQNPQVPVFLEADSAINYGVVMELMATLERAGAPGVRLITQPPQ
ncbi:MAG: protein TolR [Pseudohongiellaceae bacterium]